jgi:UDP-N-acetylglucosamine 2-epimerase (non-hydrolysing)
MRWLAVGDGHDGYQVLHVLGAVDDLCRAVPVASALDGAGSFEHIGVDASPDQAAQATAEGLGASLKMRGLDVGGRSAARRLGALLEGFDELIAELRPTAAIVYAHDDASLACAISAARQRVPVVRVLAGTEAPSMLTNSVLLNRLADLLLATDQAQADALVSARVPRQRVQVVGDPLINMIREHARRSDAAAVCRRHGVRAGGYLLAALTTPTVSDALIATLAELAHGSPLLVEVEPSQRARVAGLLAGAATAVLERSSLPTRLRLERSAGAIVTDSPRVWDRAALLGVPCRLLDDSAGDFGELAELWSPGRFRRDDKPLRDAAAPRRLADAIVANFARVVPAAP